MSKEKVRVLYIDDEINNLNSFKALFRKDHEVFLAESAEDGLKILAKEKIHVIIADQRMPGMTGVEFFESILNKFPHPVRILLTGYSDIHAVIEAINRGQIYRFIDKPWDGQGIRVAIQNAYEIYHTKFLLREQNLELQKAYEELDKFVYSASHDLRAPLVSILGIINMAKNEGMKNGPEYMAMIENIVNKTEIYVQNIIKYYRTTRIGLQPIPIRFETLIHDIWEEFKLLPEIASIKLSVDINQASIFKSDESRVRIIITNILLNAIKYQHEERPDKLVSIRVKTDEDNATIEIEDNGIGIDKEHLENIFNMFFRGAHKNSGSGVGLYVVKEALNKLNGKISVHSETNKGTTFTIDIPNRD
jgi:two-component system, sensor histidine kinase and response regulator